MAMEMASPVSSRRGAEAETTSPVPVTGFSRGEASGHLDLLGARDQERDRGWHEAQQGVVLTADTYTSVLTDTSTVLAQRLRSLSEVDLSHQPFVLGVRLGDAAGSTAYVLFSYWVHDPVQVGSRGRPSHPPAAAAVDRRGGPRSRRRRHR
jgi:hypothetical protein